MTIENWNNELKEIAVKEFGYAEDAMLDVSAFKGYYDDGLSPREALAEDCSNE